MSALSTSHGLFVQTESICQQPSPLVTVFLCGTVYSLKAYKALLSGLDIAVLFEVNTETERGREMRFQLGINERARCDSHTRVVIHLHTVSLFFFLFHVKDTHVNACDTHTYLRNCLECHISGLSGVWGLVEWACRLLGQQYGASHTTNNPAENLSG